MFLTGGGIDVDIPEYVDYEKKLLEILTLSIQGLSSVGDSDEIEKRDATNYLKKKMVATWLKKQKTGTLHVKKYNANVHDKFTKLAEDKTELVKLQFEIEQAHLQFKHNKHKLKMEILQENLKIKKNKNELLLKQIKEQDLKNTILLNQCTQD
ncbi:hypothetical protein FQA39_LY11449 [Lamprigera yunnana]|nr:hypothetical protein FQA39_LY11449 [Lamprigera yunnana]